MRESEATTGRPSPAAPRETVASRARDPPRGQKTRPPWIPRPIQSKSPEIAIADLDGESYLGRLNCEYWDHLTVLLREKQAHLTTPFRSEREDWIQTMILAGFVLSFMHISSSVMRPRCTPCV